MHSIRVFLFTLLSFNIFPVIPGKNSVLERHSVLSLRLFISSLSCLPTYVYSTLFILHYRFIYLETYRYRWDSNPASRVSVSDVLTVEPERQFEAELRMFYITKV